jgi:hypothetical protein
MVQKLNDPSPWSFSLAIRGFSKGVIDQDINIAVIGFGDRDAPTVTIHLTRPDGSTRTYTTSVLPLYRGGMDATVVTIPKSEVNLAGNYSIYADTVIDTTTITSNTHIVNVPSRIATRTFTLKNPDGSLTKKGYGSIVLVHKKTGSMAFFATDDDGKIVAPEFGTDKDWMMEVHWINPANPKEFDLILYDPLDFTTLPTEFKASGWFTEKYFKIDVTIDREKFLDILSIKNPTLAKHTWLVDNYPRLSAFIVANEVLGGMPFLLMMGAKYDATAGKLTVVFKGAGVAPLVIYAIIVCVIAVCTTAIVVDYFEMRKAEAETEQTKTRAEAEAEFHDFERAVLDKLAAGAITKEDAAVLLGAAVDYSSKWTPAVVIPSWVWGLVAVIIILVVIYVVYQVVKPKRR